MKTLFIIISCIIIAVLLLFFILGMMSKQGQALGLVDGRLSPCFDKPNCVCSEQPSQLYYIAPLSFSPSSEPKTHLILKEIIQSMDGNIEQDSVDYISATFSSSVFGFVDDLEIRIDSVQHLAHIRSASRVGYSDMGINKNRAEQLKQLYNDRVGEH